MKELTFVAFEPREEGFIASVPMEQLDSLGEHPEAIATKGQRNIPAVD